MVILLNGISSSGKSSIAKALQEMWRTPLLHVGVDTFIDLMPARFCGQGEEARDGLQFVPTQTPSGVVVAIHQGPYAKRLFRGMVGAIGALARTGNDVIVDEVLFGDELLHAYVRELRDQTVYFVAVTCSFEIIERRERERGDRFINSAKAQLPLVHGPTRQYDLEVDTSVQTPQHVAHVIKDYVDHTPVPQGFAALRQAFGIG